MNENFALEMRETADKANEAHEQKRKAVAEEWVNTTAVAAIKNTAQDGIYHVDIQIPTNVHKGYVCEYLEKCGFTLEGFGREYGRYIRIKW